MMAMANSQEMVAEFKSGPNLTSTDLVRYRVGRLAAYNEKLAKADIVPELAVITTNIADPGIDSYIRSLHNLGPKVGMTISVHNCPNERTAQYKVEQHNNIPGGTIIMVPLAEREQEAKLFDTNTREIEGLVDNSPHQPSTPRAMIDIVEYGLGHSIASLPDPERKIAIMGTGRSVGAPLLKLLKVEFKDSNFEPLVIGRDDTKGYAELPHRSVVFSAVGEPGILGPEQFGPPHIESHRFAIDAGVNRKGKKLYGDINPVVGEIVTDLMFTPPKDAVGPMNAITMLERASKLAAYMARLNESSGLAYGLANTA